MDSSDCGILGKDVAEIKYLIMDRNHREFYNQQLIKGGIRVAHVMMEYLLQ